MTPDEATAFSARAREAYAAACYLWDTTSRDLEDAYLRRDERAKEQVSRRLDLVGRLKSNAYEVLLNAQHEVAPSWEALLADPTQQFDQDGAVLASIRAYSEATLPTACGCLGAMHARCGSSASADRAPGGAA